MDIDRQTAGDGYLTRVLYDEDVMFLTKPYHDCYSDSVENNYGSSYLAIDGLVSLIEFMRE